MPVVKNGFLYIYVSNETPNIPVFFDNLQVTHVRGQILEETHYYPFGLIQAGISSKAAGTLQNKEKTFQGQRFDDDLGLDWVQFKWRNHDPQIGRFIEIDPLSEKYDYNSTYAFSENKVISHVELEGLEAVDIGAAAGAGGMGIGGALGSFVAGAGVGAVAVGIGVIGYTMANDPDLATQPYKYCPAVPGGLGAQYCNRAMNQINPESVEPIAVQENRMGDGGKQILQAKATSQKFDGQQDTESKTARQALRNAKDQNGIPRSQQPDRTIKPNTPEGDKAGLDNRNVKQDEYTNSKGQKVVIRQDKPAKYPDGGTQPPHFNAGQNPQQPKDLNQHHNYMINF